MGGSGVQRPLKFIKYLRDFGWNPIVLCPEPGMYPYFDDSLQAEVDKISPEIIRISPNTLFHLGGSSRSTQREKKIPDSAAKVVRRLLRLFMYPDNKKGWIAPAVEKGLKIIKNRNIELIFSTAPPFSNHIIGKKLSEETGKPLILDYRDAWLNNHFMDGMFGWQKQKMRKLESGCLQKADLVTGLDEFMLGEMKDEYGELIKNMEVLTHGYDPEDFDGVSNSTLDYKKGKLNFLYSGLFYESNQPDIFLKAVKKAESKGLLSTGDIHLHFQGGIDERIHQLIRSLHLDHLVTNYGYVNHKTAVANLKQADVLWMISNFDESHKQVKSGKLFEYFGSGKPVIGIVNEGKEAELLRNYGAGFVADINSEDQIAEQIGTVFTKWKSGIEMHGNAEFIHKFNRKIITKQLAEIFDKISAN